MQSVSDDDVRKRQLVKPHFELAVKGVFRLGRCYIFQQGVPGLWASNWKSTANDGWSLDRWHQKTIGACWRKRSSARKTAYWQERSKIWQCTSVKNFECQQGDYFIRSETCNQWRVASASVMRSADRRWKITRVAAFSTDCRTLLYKVCW